MQKFFDRSVTSADIVSRVGVDRIFRISFMTLLVTSDDGQLSRK